ncbi:hypothetical protein EKO27_g2848 [Xylaria grammica]|uniref:Heterokaryon incompatibility domain-containing protein n=1 Tax=Xylaria grammica TaxID=363999 RepID=A0A439DD04_9PEZI|nr:hypothetical protein EKO27_g2848 [Xylaria grammica]
MEYVKARGGDVMTKSKAAFEVAISQNPEKMRTILNSLFVPNFKPTFESDSEEDESAVAAFTEFDSVDLLAPSYSSAVADPGGLQNRYPYRMIDLDTKELVTRPEIGTLGQYCILSHSWKFPEVTFKHFAAAKSTNIEKTVERETVVNVTRLSDVDATKRRCWSDLVAQEEEVKKLVHGSDALSKLRGISNDAIVEELLRRLKDVREAESGLDGKGGEDSAKKAVADAIAARQYQKMEAGVLTDLLGDIGLEEDSIKTVVGDGVIDSGVKHPVSPVERAVKALEERRAAKISQAGNIKFFNQYGHIRNALDKLINCVTLCRSVIKIEQSIERCKEVFDRNCFPVTQKRYVWIDTCCIDKDDDSEYVRSISAMGDWYKNAEFCLVHLDSPKDFAQEWFDDWKLFSPKIREWLQDWDKFNLAVVTPGPNISTYDEIRKYKPQWSTRAWTLQELVMSKTTFFVNSNWAFLSRPVEKLGYWYYLCPFVSLYNELDTKNPFLGLLKDEKKVEELAHVLDRETIEPENLEPIETVVGKAQRLITMLDAMDFRIRGDVDLYTARAWVTQAVNVTASSLGPASTNLVAKILDVLKPTAKAPAEQYLPSDPTTLRHVIGILLKCIVTLIKQPIADDRNYIADFGNVQNLGMWQRGLVRSNFSTSKSMALMCPREATEEIDRAYGLMGMLGVRFPTFKAEGLTKALSRLLDEVVITSNDVSVFNWSGKQYGSPLRGRSLYPSLPEAYAPSHEETHKKEIEKRLAALLQIERYERLNDFEQIQGMLLGVLDFIKGRQLKDDRLLPHIRNVGKILKYIETKIEEATAQVVGKGPGDAPSSPSAFGALSSSLSSLSSHVQVPSLPKDVMSFKTPKFGSKKSGSETAASPSPSIGGFKTPSLKGFGRKDSGNSSSAESPKGNVAPTASAGPSAPSPTTTERANDETQRLEQERLKVLNAQVLSYIRSIDSANATSDNPATLERVSNLPDELKNILADIPERKFTRPKMEPDDVETMISPNPILVKSSGIEGLFDIQRVIVTLPQSAKLRRQVRNAISPTQKITGWCSISTGFAMVFVSFACPKNILEKELEVVQAVEAKILKHQEPNDGDKASSAPDRPELKRRGTSRLQRRLATQIDKDKEGNSSDEEDELMSEEVEQEGKRVSRMIRFVQEPALSLVAGEWVLARFSGVPGAKWFLCHLDMGSSGGDFYGHRIATDEINFRNASPELGLMKYWENYMMQKKYRLCSLIQKLVKSKDWGNIKEKANQGLAFAAGSPGVSSNTEEKNNESDSDSDSGMDAITGALKEIGELAVAMASAGMAQTFYERWASRLEKSLNADVLKMFPVHMQAALQSLDDNRDLMPSMFHSAKRIHMF